MITQEMYKKFKELEVLLKARRPELSVAIAKSKTAQEVAEHIASAWVGYGLTEDQSDEGNPRLTIKTKPETFSEAMKYLWFKPTQEGNATVYRMGALPFQVSVVVNGETHQVVVQPKAS